MSRKKENTIRKKKEYANIRIDIEVWKVLQRIKTEKLVNTLSNVVKENLEELGEM